MSQAGDPCGHDERSDGRTQTRLELTTERAAGDRRSYSFRALLSIEGIPVAACRGHVTDDLCTVMELLAHRSEEAAECLSATVRGLDVEDLTIDISAESADVLRDVELYFRSNIRTFDQSSLH